jgi:hypothetical protein
MKCSTSSRRFSSAQGRISDLSAVARGAKAEADPPFADNQEARFWRKAAVRGQADDVRSWGQSRLRGYERPLPKLTPTATLVVHRGNGFDAGFRPYQSARLSRYNAGPQSSLVSIVGSISLSCCGMRRVVHGQ